MRKRVSASAASGRRWPSGGSRLSALGRTSDEDQRGERGAQPERLEHADRLDDAHGERRAGLDGEREDDDEGGRRRRVAAAALAAAARSLSGRSCRGESTEPRPARARVVRRTRPMRCTRLHTTLVSSLPSWYFFAFPSFTD